ncbi:flagellar basal body P-ring formation chaperone FlgA [Acetobacter persici]|uniref:Flagellar biosynthesis protein FlgA n=1 Tax=Acetobacter persici TaxID=1076596 RepID=A0A1U9LIT2_9PROT|nr:flagellar basal body P-ring formation chaperone FlgA [Acetobacter persici]AQT06346.1 flagellar biosynthesis protein FlgA [Acetobacter persici]
MTDKKPAYGKIYLSAAIACMLGGVVAAHSAVAATLRPSGDISAPTVSLSDIFDGLEAGRDRVLGPAPAPGKSIQIGGYQLIAIADQYGVDWEDQSSSVMLTLTRSGRVVGRDYIASLVKRGLGGSGEGAVVSVENFKPITVPSDDKEPFVLSDVNWDKKTGKFFATAYRSHPTGVEAEDTVQIKGEVQIAQPVMVYNSAFPAGYIIADGDVHVDQSYSGNLVPGSVPAPDDVVGMALSHPVAEGTPVLSSDLRKTLLVHRGDPVLISFSSPGIHLSATGRALEEGGKSQFVHALNLGSKMIVYGRVSGAGEVTVDAASTAISSDSSEAKKLGVSALLVEGK